VTVEERASVATLRKHCRAIDLQTGVVGEKNRGGSSVFVLGTRRPQVAAWQAHRRQALHNGPAAVSAAAPAWQQPSAEATERHSRTSPGWFTNSVQYPSVSGV
jgi:hypothetical protein